MPILTRVETDEGATKATRAGATGVVSPHVLGGWRMAHALIRPHTTTFLDLATLAEHAEFSLDEVLVASGCATCGRPIRELPVGDRHGVLVVAIRRADGRIVPTPGGSTVVESGDVLIVAGAPEAVRRFEGAVAG